MSHVKSAFVLVVLVGMLQSGCGSSSNVDTAVSTQPPDFFFCSRWEDQNQDGKIQQSEWVAVKDSFAYNEQVTCVAEIRGKAGATLRFKLTGPAGEAVKTSDSPVAEDVQIRSYSFEPLELHKLGGTGRYVVEWFLNGVLIKRLPLTIFT